jgi:hypothetical protein
MHSFCTFYTKNTFKKQGVQRFSPLTASNYILCSLIPLIIISIFIYGRHKSSVWISYCIHSLLHLHFVIAHVKMFKIKLLLKHTSVRSGTWKNKINMNHTDIGCKGDGTLSGLHLMMGFHITHRTTALSYTISLVQVPDLSIQGYNDVQCISSQSLKHESPNFGLQLSRRHHICEK